jgi:hypothetical protein
MEHSLEVSVRFSDSHQNVRVNKYDPMSVLTSHFPQCTASSHVFILSNQVAMPAFSFAFYRVRDGDEIALVKTGDGPRPRRRPTIRHFPSLAQLQARSNELYQLFGYRSDGESMQRAVEELADPDVAAEAARLRDQCFSRIEGSLSSHRRLVARFAGLNEPKEPARGRDRLALAPAPTAPNSDALPCGWARRKKDRSDL